VRDMLSTNSWRERDDMPRLMRWALNTESSKRIQRAHLLYTNCELESDALAERLAKLEADSSAFLAVKSSKEELAEDKTFHSWFNRTLLTVWLAMVRLRVSDDANEANKMSQELFNRFWSEAELQMMSCGLERVPGAAFVIGKNLKIYSQFYFGTVVAYDDGLANGDARLADALWRNLFAMQTCRAGSLYALVDYVRRQLAFFDSTAQMPGTDGRLQFAPSQDIFDHAMARVHEQLKIHNTSSSGGGGGERPSTQQTKTKKKTKKKTSQNRLKR
jgi:hypothetical protein